MGALNVPEVSKIETARTAESAHRMRRLEGARLLSNSPCGKLDGYGGWWFWRRRHQQHGSYRGRIRSELA